MTKGRIAAYVVLVLLVIAGVFAYQNRLYIRMAIQQPQLFREPVFEQSAAPLPADLGTVPILSFSKPTVIDITTVLLRRSKCWMNWLPKTVGSFSIPKTVPYLRRKICNAFGWSC